MFPTRILLVFNLITQICCVDQEKAAWFESDSVFKVTFTVASYNS